MAVEFSGKPAIGRIFSAVIFAAIAGFNPGTAVASSDVPDVLFSSFVDEFRFGVMYNDLHLSRKREEGGVNINAEMLFRRPNVYYDNKLLLFALNPRPHLGGSFNTAGDTSQAYLGLTWDYRLTNNMFAEIALGGAIHDGKLNSTAAPGLATSLGCRVLFRSGLSAGYELTEKIRLIITYTHIGGAGLCNSSSGLSTIGGRIGYKF